MAVGQRGTLSRLNRDNRHRGKVNDLVTIVLVWGGRKSLILKMNLGMRRPFQGAYPRRSRIA